MGNKNIWTLEDVATLREYLSSALLRADHLSDREDLNLIFHDIEIAKAELHKLCRILDNQPNKERTND